MAGQVDAFLIVTVDSAHVESSGSSRSLLGPSE